MESNCGVVTVANAFLLTNVNEVIQRTHAAATVLPKVGCDFYGTFELYFTQEQPYSLSSWQLKHRAPYAGHVSLFEYFSVENTHTDRRCIQSSDTCRSGRGHSETWPFRLRWSLCQGRHRCPQTGSNDPETTRTDPFVFIAGIASEEWACKILIFCEIT